MYKGRGEGKKKSKMNVGIIYIFNIVQARKTR